MKNNRCRAVSIPSQVCRMAVRFALLSLIITAFAPVAFGQAVQVLYNFQGGSDGENPWGPLVQGRDGNFYGTTSGGGSGNRGTVFQITPARVHTVLATFRNSDGAHPVAGLVEGSDGFYGTTPDGGATGDGTVFKVTTARVLTTLASFRGAVSGAHPGYDRLLWSNDGFLYGTTRSGAGAVGRAFKMAPDGTFIFMKSTIGSDWAGLVQGTDAFYGMDGVSFGGGAPFKITSTGLFTSLGTFSDPDGNTPRHAMVLGRDGKFYGTLSHASPAVFGFIYVMESDGTVKPLVPFNGANGSCPDSLLIQGTDGNFYGTTRAGGATRTATFAGNGTVFKVTPGGILTTLASHGPAPGGGTDDPRSGVIQASDGNFYGTTFSGGPAGHGTVYIVVNTAPRDVTPPSVPIDLKATPELGKQIDLSWGVSTDNPGGSGLAGYKVYQRGTLVKTTTGPGTTHSVTGLDECTEYCYTVSAYDFAGNESAQSAQACATTFDETGPSIPVVVVTAMPGKEIDLSWAASSVKPGCPGVTEYRIYRDRSTTPFKTVPASKTSYSDTGLNECEQHCYTVAAFNGQKESEKSGEVCATTLEETGPSPPVARAEAKVGKKIELSWTDSTVLPGCPAVLGYNIYDHNGTKLNPALVTLKEFQVTGLDECKEYCFTVKAFDGVRESMSPGSEACATTLDETGPSAPVVSAAATAGKKIELSWTDSTVLPGCPPVQGYNVYDDSGTKLNSGLLTMKTFTFTGSEECKLYCFRVTAYDGTKESALSTMACAKTLGTTAPTVPSSVASIAKLSTQIDVTWRESTDNPDCGSLFGYGIYRDGTLVTVQPPGPPGMQQFSDTGLDPCSSHCYEVSAIGGALIESARSSPASCVETLDAPPSTPMNLKAMAVAPDRIDLKWDASTGSGKCGLAGYRVYHKREWKRPGSSTTLFVWWLVKVVKPIPPATVPLTKTSITGLDAGETYCYAVTSFDDGGGASSRSSEACAKTPPPPVPRPPDCFTTIVTSEDGWGGAVWMEGDGSSPQAKRTAAIEAAINDATRKASDLASRTCAGNGMCVNNVTLRPGKPIVYESDITFPPPPRMRPGKSYGVKIPWTAVVVCCPCP